MTRRSPALLLRAVLLVLAFLTCTRNAAAQPSAPIGPFVVDVRAGLPWFHDDAAIASAIGVGTGDLPGRGLSLGVGAHWYAIRKKVALGLGAELIVGGATMSREADEDEPTTIPGPTVNARLRAFTPQMSLNFGGRRGWSYLTAGLGWGGLTTEREDAPVAAAESNPRVVNYGGGARWFAREHVAFTADLRFYNIAAQEATVGRPAYPGVTMMVFSAGVAFK